MTALGGKNYNFSNEQEINHKCDMKVRSSKYSGYVLIFAGIVLLVIEAYNLAHYYSMEQRVFWATGPLTIVQNEREN